MCLQPNRSVSVNDNQHKLDQKQMVYFLDQLALSRNDPFRTGANLIKVFKPREQIQTITKALQNALLINQIGKNFLGFAILRCLLAFFIVKR